MPPAASTSDPGLPSTPYADILVQLGSEVVQPLLVALERLKELQLTEAGEAGAALAALREPLRRARDNALLAQQIGRLGSGRVQAAREPLTLNTLVAQVVEKRRREAAVRGLQLRAELEAAEIEGDGALVASLLNALLDWALIRTRSSIDIVVQLTPWPIRARLRCRFAVRELDQQPVAAHAAAEKGLHWQLIVQIASCLGVSVRREDEAGICVACLDFPLPRMQELVEQIDLGLTAHEAASNTQPFAGWQALLVSQHPPLIQQVRALMEPTGWLVDQVASIDQAFQHCLAGLPEVILVDGRLHGPDLEQFCCHVRADAPRFPIIEFLSQDATPRERRLVLSLCREAQMESQLPLLLRRTAIQGDPELTLRL
ncbi:CheY-like chemotaxis protein [Inhella inkyongensis]|uniref:CheY-like chemotaxis protein n=1 Tax=Inhella inkyongensis TaxID=392593 RepID=A0A840S974_9BURK|nr:response regulator [Inhella inkyongensis]MBB5206193.1 CheY-like chemotaxis protein [Inhella inkyongensis]